MAVVYWHNSGVVQISCCLMLSGFFAVLNIVYRPMKSKRGNIVLIISQVLYALADMVFLALAANTRKMELWKQKLYFGNTLIAIISMIIAVNVLNSGVEVIIGIRECCRKRKLRKEKEAKLKERQENKLKKGGKGKKGKKGKNNLAE